MGSCILSCLWKLNLVLDHWKVDPHLQDIIVWRKREMATVDGVTAALNSNDILSEILIRLPPELVFRLVIVSKRWLQFICSPSFCQSYLNHWKMSYRLLGFCVCNNLYLGRPRDGLKRPQSEPAFPLLSTCDEGHDLGFSGILKQLGYFIDSSNGLLLCGRHPKTYYVWNPITKQRYQLPPPRVYFEELCMAFIVEDCPSEDMSYKVIRAKCEIRSDKSKTVPIETFNPRTRTWNYSTLTCLTEFSLCPWIVATVIKGVIHWYAAQGNLAIYDPNYTERCIGLTKLPGSTDYDERSLGETSDGLLQYGWSNKSGMEIWVLKKDNDSFGTIFSQTSLNAVWTFRYRLSFKTMWKKNPTLMKKFCRKNKETQILSFLPCNSDSVFVRSESDIFQCHLMSDLVESVPYHGRGPSLTWDFCKVVPYFRPSWPQSSLCCKENIAT